MDFSKVTVITGHYGSGKTNFAANMAMELSRRGEKCTVVDLDIVNPYFRTADFRELFADNNIRLVAPIYANTNLDTPVLNFDVATIAGGDGYTIIDVGGDDAGATALGQYAHILEKLDMSMLYVVNCYRYLTREPEEALALMRDIEAASRLKCTGIVNNSNLGYETTNEVIASSVPYAEKIAEAAGLPLVCNAGKNGLTDNIPDSFPVDIYVKTLWS